MHATNILFLVLGLSLFAFYLGRGRSLALAKPLGGIRHIHSLPSYYGAHVALWCALPSLVLLGLWMIFDDVVIDSIVLQSLPAGVVSGISGDDNLLLNKISNLAAGVLSARDENPALVAAAESMLQLQLISRWALTALMLTLSLICIAWSWSQISITLRARPAVEKVMEKLLLACACVAIFTTVGIVLSVLFESIQFFRSVP